MKSKIKIASTGTGSTDGLASQLLCKINILLFAQYNDFDYVNLPFDDSFILGNSGHRYGNFSTAFQNIVFSFPESEIVNPLSLNIKKIKRLCSSAVQKNGTLFYGQDNTFLPSDLSLEKTNAEILSFITKNSDAELIIIDGFPNLYINNKNNYLDISRPTQRVIDPSYNYFSWGGYSKNPNEIIVSFHVRRGDVNQENYPDRFLQDSYFNNLALKLETYFKSRNIRYKIFVHSEDESLKLSFDNILVVDPNPIRSFVNLSASDIVVCSRSAHSSVPPLVSGCLALIPELNWLPSLPGWIKVNKYSEFNFDLLDEYFKP